MSKLTTAADIFFLVPNLITYARVLCLVTFAVQCNAGNHYFAAFSYILCSILDALDGFAARSLNQCSKLGEILDILVDRAANIVMVVTLASLYPSHTLILYTWLCLQVTCQWIYVHSSSFNSLNHRSPNQERNMLINIFYTEPYFSAIFYGSEIFLTALYLLRHATAGLGLWKLTAYVTFPVIVAKTIVLIVQFTDGAAVIAREDVRRKNSS